MMKTVAEVIEVCLPGRQKCFCLFYVLTIVVIVFIWTLGRIYGIEVKNTPQNLQNSTVTTMRLMRTDKQDVKLKVWLPPAYSEVDFFNRTSDLREAGYFIPNIVHQAWPTFSVPRSYQPFVTTWLKQNPNWQYWFWSDEDAESLVTKLYPEHYALYKKDLRSIHRRDVIRYFILHTFGGWFADLGVENLKPLEEMKVHSCIVAQEPWADMLFVMNRETLASNSVMAARRKHPFIKTLIDKLRKSFERNTPGVIETVGLFTKSSEYIDTQLREYEIYRKKTSNLIPKEDAVYLAKPSLFKPTSSTEGLNAAKEACRGELSGLRKHLCDRLNSENWTNSMAAEALTNHWRNGSVSVSEEKSDGLSIFRIIPKTVNVTNVMARIQQKR